jgi:hypothetical protein
MRTSLLARAAVSVVLGALALASPRGASADVTVAKVESIDLRVDLYGWVQPRLSVPEQDRRPFIDARPTPAFTLMRTRLGAIGMLSKWAKVQVELGMERELAQPIDAFVDLTPVVTDQAALGVRLGQFRVPFSRQNLNNGRVYQLPDTAYFVLPRYVLNRDIGAMAFGHFLRDRLHVFAGVFNGNEAGFGQPINLDENFLFAARVELTPLGLVPRLESDVRSALDRKDPRLHLGGGVMHNRRTSPWFDRTYGGVDLAFFWQGLSLNAEGYYRVDEPYCARRENVGGADACVEPVSPEQRTEALGGFVQVGYFPHLPWVHEHLELAFRAQAFDPNQQVSAPQSDVLSRELDTPNATWGFWGFTFGLNLFPLPDMGDNLKLQASYELRNEQKPCLADVPCGPQGQATGHIANNLFLLQATGGF